MASPCRHLLVPVLVTRGSWPCRRCLLCGWSGEHHRAALLALALYAFDPNILAQSALATLDLGVTCLIFATMYVVGTLLRRPTAAKTILTGALSMSRVQESLAHAERQLHLYAWQVRQIAPAFKPGGQADPTAEER